MSMDYGIVHEHMYYYYVQSTTKAIALIHDTPVYTGHA